MENMTEMAKTKEAKGITTLAFRVKPQVDGLFAAEIIKLEGNKITGTREGVATDLGHAIAIADELFSSYSVQVLHTGEATAETFFTNVTI